MKIKKIIMLCASVISVAITVPVLTACDKDGEIVEPDITVSEHTHENLTFVPAVAATCQSEGKLAHYVCSCGEMFLDSEAQIRTDSFLIITETGNHKLEYIEGVQPTFETDGILSHFECEFCHKNYFDAYAQQFAESVVIKHVEQYVTEERINDDGFKTVIETEHYIDGSDKHVTTTEYNANNVITFILERSYDEDSSLTNEKTTYYDDNGEFKILIINGKTYLSQSITIDVYGNSFFTITEYEYDTNDKLIKSLEETRNQNDVLISKCNKEYDSNENVIKATTENYNSETILDEIKVEISEYNESGIAIKYSSKLYYSDGAIKYIYDNERDSNGDIIYFMHKGFNEYGIVTTHVINNVIFVSSTEMTDMYGNEYLEISENEYDDRLNIIKTIVKQFVGEDVIQTREITHVFNDANNETSNTTLIYDSDGKLTSKQSISVDYDTNQNKTKETISSYDGNELLTYYTCNLYYENGNKLSFYNAYYRNGIIAEDYLTELNVDQNATKYVMCYYDDMGKISERSVTTYEYDDNLVLIKSTQNTYDGSEKLREIYETQYDDNGVSLVVNLTQYGDNGELIFSQKDNSILYRREYVYDNFGNIVLTIERYYTYDENDKQINEIEKNYNSENVLTFAKITTFDDEAGKKESESVYYQNGEVVSIQKESIIYTDDGLVAQEKCVYYDGDGEKKSTAIYKYEYDLEGNKVTTIYENYGCDDFIMQKNINGIDIYSTSTHYDGNWNITKYVGTKFEYDSAGKIIKEEVITYSPTREIMEKSLIEKEYENTKIKVKTTVNYDAYNSKTSTVIEEYSYQYPSILYSVKKMTYDANDVIIGHSVTAYEYRDDGKISKTTKYEYVNQQYIDYKVVTTYSYDANGNPNTKTEYIPLMSTK